MKVYTRYLSVSALVLMLNFNVAAQDGGDIEKGAQVFNQCAACHMIGENAVNAFGPVLTGVVGRPAGSYPEYPYSNSVKKAGEEGLVWTKENLFNWLENPAAYIKSHLGDDSASTKMPVTFGDPDVRNNVIAFLETHKAGEASAEANEGEEEQSLSHGSTPFDESLVDGSGGDHPADKLDRVKQDLVAPPMLPEHTQVAEGDPKVVEVVLTVEEKKWVLDSNGTEINALTYNGTIPAPAIVVHQNDYVELTLKNPATNQMVHNIDLHAVTGALGGAAITTISPGQEVTIRFKATKSGAFLYHCAPEGSMTPYHVTHGMTGTIMVLPRDGLKDGEGNSLVYDKAYYVGENDFYVPTDADGNYKTYANTAEDYIDWIQAMKTLTPSHIVFNGRVGALTGEGAMTASVGDNVLFLHMQGNRDTRPHLIGGHGDFVWEEGSFVNPPMKDLETWFVRGGSVGAALYRFEQPGVYAYLNHNLIEAVEFGAAGHVVVDGEWNDDLLLRVNHGPIIE